MELFINTINSSKISEIKEIFNNSDFSLKFLDYNITEILSHDLTDVIKKKAADAYAFWRVPIVVEHGALYIKYFNEFPGPLSKPMWDLMKDKICHLIPKGENRDAVVRSAVCYCDGKTRKVFIGETKGEISLIGRGTNGFQFDPIFIPEYIESTYAELKQFEKLKYSQATKAYNQLMSYLRGLQ